MSKRTNKKKLNQKNHNLSNREDSTKKTKYWKIFWGTTVFSIIIFSILLVLFVNHVIDSFYPNLMIFLCYSGLFLYWMARKKAIVMEDDIARLSIGCFAIAFMSLFLLIMFSGEMRSEHRGQPINTDFIEGYMQGVAVGSVIS